MIDKEFKQRQKRLLDSLGDNAVAIIPAAKEKYRNRYFPYPYRQHSDFYYFTAFPEADAVAVFIPGRKHGEYILFNSDRDIARELWIGEIIGQDRACKNYGAGQAFSITAIDEMMPELLADREKVFFPIGEDPEFDAKVMTWVGDVKNKMRGGVNPPEEFIYLGKISHEMRIKKSKKEIELVKTAANINVSAFKKAMQKCKPKMYEYELEAEVVGEFIRNNARFPAFETVVASGSNSCFLHYVKNNNQINDGDLVLIDAGAEYNNYASDITRTFPANGRFTEEQKLIYMAVLAAQKAVIAEVKPGIKWIHLQEAAEKVITDHLHKLGIMPRKLLDLITKRACREFFPHNIGHMLGMDVHEVGKYKLQNDWRVLQPGMIFTVEPGIYIHANNHSVDRKWRGIGVRIEDDVLVTEEGCEVLTKDLPKEIDEIEALMCQ